MNFKGNDMMRAFKALTTTNLLLTALVVVGYLVYGLAGGLPINERFLGCGPGGLSRGTDPTTAPWVFAVIIEAVIVITFFYSRFADGDMKGHRILCAVVGVIEVGGLLMGHLPNYDPLGAVGSPSVGMPFFDRVLAWYVAWSHIGYALIGPNE